MSEHQEPRAIVQYFAAAMEVKLAANEHKGGWKQDKWLDLYQRLVEEKTEFLEALIRFRNASRFAQTQEDLDKYRADVLAEAADCANFLAMICDVIGALPPTDEKGGAQ